jgi:hypothetical protein
MKNLCMFFFKAFFGVFMVFCLTLIINGCSTAAGNESTDNRIQPYTSNPSYWQYRNNPVLLLGGSSDDNLFQHTSPGLDRELDRLVKFGGNYVRCTMSARDSGNVQAFHFDPATQKYDLRRWNDEYWRRFDYFLKAAHDRQIIVQVEIWATYDFYTREGHIIDGLTAWDRNPFNPGNNINYNERESGLYETFRSTHGTLINPFFLTVMPLREPFDFDIKPVVLEYQQLYVDKLLSISLDYDHVLYVIDNETNTDPHWSKYWSQYIRKKASERGVGIEVTEMWDTFDPTDGAVEGASVQHPSTHFFTRRASVSNTLYDPDNYSYLDISNHNAQRGEVHYQTGLYVWNEVQKSGIIRPINNTKVYGADGGWSANTKEGKERFWRNIFAGAASARFHRQPSGLGDSDMAMYNIQSMRMLTDAIDIFGSTPANQILSDRSDNEGYCLADGQGAYILYFPEGGNVRLEASGGNYELTWLKIGTSEWQKPRSMRLPGNIAPPNNEPWALLVKRK